MKICEHTKKETGKCTDVSDDGLRKGKFCDGKVTNCKAYTEPKKPEPKKPEPKKPEPKKPEPE